jgi:hypothetical protein
MKFAEGDFEGSEEYSNAGTCVCFSSSRAGPIRAAVFFSKHGAHGNEVSEFRCPKRMTHLRGGSEITRVPGRGPCPRNRVRFRAEQVHYGGVTIFLESEAHASNPKTF